MDTMASASLPDDHTIPLPPPPPPSAALENGEDDSSALEQSSPPPENPVSHDETPIEVSGSYSSEDEGEASSIQDRSIQILTENPDTPEKSKAPASDASVDSRNEVTENRVFDAPDEKLLDGGSEASASPLKPVIETEIVGVVSNSTPERDREKQGDIDSASSDRILEGVANSEPVEPESIGVAGREVEVDGVEGSGFSPDVPSASLDKTLKFDSTESKIDARGAENDEDSAKSSASLDSGDKPDGGYVGEGIISVGDTEKDESLNGVSVSLDSEIGEDSAVKHDDANGADEVYKVSVTQDTADQKTMRESDELVSFEEVESSQALNEQSKSIEEDEVVVEESHIEKDEDSCVVSGENQSPVSISGRDVKIVEVGAYSAPAFIDDDDDEKEEEMGMNDTEAAEGSGSDVPARIAILESSETAKQILKELEKSSTNTGPFSGLEQEQSHDLLDGQIVTDSDDEVDSDEDAEGGELFDPAALTALLKAATSSSSNGDITITSQDAARIFNIDRPAGLGSSVPALKPAAPRSSRPSSLTPSDLTVVGEPMNDMNEEDKKLQDKVEQMRVKFIRLVQRLGLSPEDTVAAQVLYRLSLAEGIRRGRQMSRVFSIETAKKKALQLEEQKNDDLDFSCNILILGKSGVGKTATINSIFRVVKSPTSAFQPATTYVKEISGVIDGVKVRVIDTPGLRASMMDQAANRKILLAIKNYTKKCPPDIVLYVDRLDMLARDFSDLPLLKSITSILGASIWLNAIVALSHAATAPPDGPHGSPLSYEVFVAQRSHIVQHSIRQAAGDMRLMNPVALVENHTSCRRNRDGERVLPNGLTWRSQLLLLCYSSKILTEANSLLKLQDTSSSKLFGFRVRSPPLPFLLSSLLQSRAHPKLSTDQGGDNVDSDIDLDDLSDADQDEEEDEYDELPPFKPLKKSQIEKLTKEQKRAYFDEYDYRVKLLQKKQWKDELRRLKETKKKGKSQRDDSTYGDMAEDFDDGAPAAVPVPLPDMVLPPSFDCDSPVYRYRFLEPTSQLLIRPVLDSHGWDHDCGYDGVSIEESLAVAGQFPAGVSVQITKDKKEFNIHLDSSVAARHGENGSSLAGFDIQSIGKQLAYIIRGETKFKNMKKNKTAAGFSVTFLGENMATGLKIEDHLSIGKRVGLVASTGAIRSQGEVAYGANLEARLREKDYPIGQALSTLGLSLMKWRGDLALGANLQSQFSVARNSKMVVRVGLNNKLSGQITVRTSSSEHLHIALAAAIPVGVSVFKSLFSGESYLVH